MAGLAGAPETRFAWPAAFEGHDLRTGDDSDGDTGNTFSLLGRGHKILKRTQRRPR